MIMDQKQPAGHYLIWSNTYVIDHIYNITNKAASKLAVIDTMNEGSRGVADAVAVANRVR